MGAETRVRWVVTESRVVRPSLEAMMQERAPCLLAVARRLLLDESEARELVEFAMEAARELLPQFRATSPGDWLQGLVVGLAVARAQQRRHT